MNDKWITIYVNDVELHATHGKLTTHINLHCAGCFFVDSTDTPFTRCAEHHLSRSDVAHMLNHGAIYTSGNLYSFYQRN